jgi:hypothetical protein
MHTIAIALCAAAVMQANPRITVEIREPGGGLYDTPDVRITADPGGRSFHMRRVSPGVWDTQSIPEAVQRINLYIVRPRGPNGLNGDRGSIPKEHLNRPQPGTILRIRLLTRDTIPVTRNELPETMYYVSCVPVIRYDACGCCCIEYVQVLCPCPEQVATSTPAPSVQLSLKSPAPQVRKAPIRRAKIGTVAYIEECAISLAPIPERIRIPFSDEIPQPASRLAMPIADR